MKKIFAGCFLLLMIGCAEKPKMVGGPLVGSENISSLDTATIYSTSNSTFTSSLITGYGASNLVGRNANDEEIASFYKFVPSGSLDSLVGATLDTTEIRLTVNYRLHVTAPPVEFELHEITASWTQGALNKDSSASRAIGTTLVGTFSSTDSMNYGSTVTAKMDTSVIRRWIESYRDTSTADFYGFAMQPKSGIVTGIVGFSTFSDLSGYYPKLVVKYTTRYGTHDSLVVGSGEDTYIARLTTNPTSFQVHGGFGVRSKLFFDVNSLLKTSMVHGATLTLVSDTTSSMKGGFAPDSLLAYLGVKGTVDADSFSTSLFVYGIHKTDSLGNSVYEFDVFRLIQSWVNNTNVNDGFVLRWASEFSTAEKISFYDSNADATKRPKIKLMYSNR